MIKFFYKICILILGLLFLTIAKAEICPDHSSQVFDAVTIGQNNVLYCFYKCHKSHCYPDTISLPGRYKPEDGPWIANENGSFTCVASAESCRFEKISSKDFT